MAMGASCVTCISWVYGNLYIDGRDQYWMDGLITAVTLADGNACMSVSGVQQQTVEEGGVGVVDAIKLRKYTNRVGGAVLWLPLCDRGEGRDMQVSIMEYIPRVYRSDSIDTVIEKLVRAYHVREQLDGKRRWSQPPKGAELSPQEHNVIRLVGYGLSPGVIARILGIHPKTVSTHKCNAMRKLGLRRTQDLFHWLRLSGLLKLKSK